MSTVIIPTNDDLAILKDRLSEQKRIAEYQQLKKDLEEMTTKVVNTPSDLEGSMQVPDTDKVLVTKRLTHSIVEKIVDRALKMCAIQPIIGSIIAIMLPIGGMFFLHFLSQLASKHGVHWLAQGLPYFMKGSIIAISLAILASASRSILLPVLGMVVAGFFCSILQGHETVLHFGFNDFLILGVTSFVASLFSTIAIR